MNAKQSFKNRFTNLPIGRKIVIICLVLVIIPTLAVGYIAYTSAESAIQESIRFTLVTQATDMHESTESMYNTTLDEVNWELSHLRKLVNAKGNPSIVNDNLVLGSSYVVNDNYELVDAVQDLVGSPATIFQKKGDQAIRISTNIRDASGKRAVGTPVSQKVYDTVIGKGETFYGRAQVLGKDYITTYEPLKDQEGTIIGILFVGVDEGPSFAPLKEQMRAKKVGEGGYVYIINSTGSVLLHPTIEGQNVSDLPFVKEIIEQKNGFTRYTWKGVDKFAAFSYFEPLDWYIVITGNVEDFTGPLTTIKISIIITIILGIIAGIIIATLFGRSISRRMELLVSSAGKVRDGELSQDIQSDQQTDEIGILTSVFADMATTLRLFRDEVRSLSSAAAAGDLSFRSDVTRFHGDYAEIISGVNKTVDAIALPLNEAMELATRYASGDFTAQMNPDICLHGEFSRFRDALDTVGKDVSAALMAVQVQMTLLSDRMNGVRTRVDMVTQETDMAGKSISDVSEGVGQVALIAEAVSSLAEKSGSTTSQILVAMQDLATTVSSVAGRMEQVSTRTSVASELSEKGQAAITQVNLGMQDIIRSSSAIDEMNREMHGQMDEIGRIVEMITGIAEQTSLLALNAAIEAARAGDAGRGFAVVAAEVKDLAHDSQNSAEKIAGIIEGLRKRSGAMAEAVTDSLIRVRAGNDSVHETLAIFHEIAGSITEIYRQVSEVAAASEEQAASVQEVTATVNEFSEMVLQTAKESVGLAAASEESSAAVSQIVQMVSQVTASMGSIRSETQEADQAVSRINDEMSVFTVE